MADTALAGKVALVTGATSGIGEAIASHFAAAGAKVAICGRRTTEGAAVAERIAAGGGEAFFMPCDVSDSAALEAFVARTVKTYGRIDAAVNCAGIGCPDTKLADITEADFDMMIRINLRGVWLAMKHEIRQMLAQGGGGSIINMSSLAGLKGAAGLTAYCATKGGVRLFTKAVAMECAAAHDNVRVNSVHPGIIETPIWGGIATGLAGDSPLIASGSGGANMPDLDAMSTVIVPVGKKGLPEDIAQGVLFLASDDSRYMTGTELVIDGGMSTR